MASVLAAGKSNYGKNVAAPVSYTMTTTLTAHFTILGVESKRPYGWRPNMEHDLGDGWRVIIEWSPDWGAYIGTLTDPAGNTAGSILRDTDQRVLESALQSVERKG